MSMLDKIKTQMGLNEIQISHLLILHICASINAQICLILLYMVRPNMKNNLQYIVKDQYVFYSWTPAKQGQ